MKDDMAAPAQMANRTTPAPPAAPGSSRSFCTRASPWRTPHGGCRAPSADALQSALIAFRRTALGWALDPWWSAIGVHREAEFSPEHRPAFLTGKPPARYVCVYPNVRSLEWYLLPAEERHQLLGEHGRMGRDYPEVQQAFEADELELLVNLMRHLRGAAARPHTRSRAAVPDRDPQAARRARGGPPVVAAQRT